MNTSSIRHYDIAIVGAGPVGVVCSLAYARKGARVALIEENPEFAKRMAGEWLHPPAVRILRDVGVNLSGQHSSSVGKGFVVYPEDGADPIVLSYPDSNYGLSCSHESIVHSLRDIAEQESGIDYLAPARVCSIEVGQITYKRDGELCNLSASRIVGADGRGSIVRRSLGLQTKRMAVSRMVGIKLGGFKSPFADYGCVLCGGPGPVLIYQIGSDCIRIIADVPLDGWASRDIADYVVDSYTDVLPPDLRTGFVDALRRKDYEIAANEMRPRLSYGNSDRVLIGDAAGHYHPMTANGMTIGFGDALALVESDNFEQFKARRFRSTNATDLLALGLYEIFADYRAESVALRRAIYKRWRDKSSFRKSTVRTLSCQSSSTFNLGFNFSAILLQTIKSEVRNCIAIKRMRRARGVLHSLTARLFWFLRAVRGQRVLRGTSGEIDEQVRDDMSRAFPISVQASSGVIRFPRSKRTNSPDVSLALQKSIDRLVGVQREDGAWEGEMTWCPMLAAQLVLMSHITQDPISPERKRLLVRHFECTRLEQGVWGMHEHSEPHLFVTALVYVAARLIGIERGDPLLQPATDFFRRENVLHIPSWGKFWLALLNLYDWRGVNAPLPELWSLPRWTVLHPSNWYCHTRLIYMAMSAIYSRRYQVPVTPLIESIREELFIQEYSSIDFSKARTQLRSADLFAAPSRWLRTGYRLARLFDRFHSKSVRARLIDELMGRIRWELQTTDHTGISPVSGLLNIIALWLTDPDDADCARAKARLDGWIWEDPQQGTRVTGARSASWDTGIALQSLAAACSSDEQPSAFRRGAAFLLQNQIAESFEGYRESFRNDPKGGWCFAGGWHGWPVSDCTAEAMLGLIDACEQGLDASVPRNAIRFMLSTQNRDGGFGSYEAQRSMLSLEWLNPAEMFGESMTEHSYVECTASCLAALAACSNRFPETADESVSKAILRSETWLRRNQGSDGSWRGVWGVQFIYGTYFGIRGLMAAGARPGDNAIRSACRWLIDRQLEDGGWGEHYSGCMTATYVPHEQSQVIQTSWALIALMTANDPNWDAVLRGVHYLLDTQDETGAWPRQDMVGVFFRTALLDYALYRQYFPLHALGLYNQRCRARVESEDSVASVAQVQKKTLNQ